MKRLKLILIFLVPILSQPLFSLEEKQYQARIIIEESEKPEMLFPLSLLSYEKIKEIYLMKSFTVDYIMYGAPEKKEDDARDLCGFQEPMHIIPEGDIL